MEHIVSTVSPNFTLLQQILPIVQRDFIVRIAARGGLFIAV